MNAHESMTAQQPETTIPPEQLAVAASSVIEQVHGVLIGDQEAALRPCVDPEDRALLRSLLESGTFIPDQRYATKDGGTIRLSRQTREVDGRVLTTDRVALHLMDGTILFARHSQLPSVDGKPRAIGALQVVGPNMHEAPTTEQVAQMWNGALCDHV